MNKAKSKFNPISIANPTLVECTNIQCDNTECDYCRQCSHAIHHGFTKIKKEVIHWTYRPYFGVEFYDEKENILTEYPDEKHKIWEIHYQWLKDEGLE